MNTDIISTGMNQHGEVERLEVLFQQPFNNDTYQTFIRSKSLPEYNLKYDWETDSYKLTCPIRFASIFGLEDVAPTYGFLPKNQHLFDYQDYIVYQFALPLKRYAVWSDTGTGKTIMLLELSKQVMFKTRGRVLILTKNELINQTIDEKTKFFGDEFEIERINSRAELRAFCKGSGPAIGITNHEKFIPKKGEPETISECQYLAGVMLDEASVLKSGGGTIKWSMIKSCRGVEYKYAFTATPAPNSVIEFASQASFLEKIKDNDQVLWTYFKRNKAGDFEVKDMARAAFYNFMAGWSVYLKDPAKYGFNDILKDLPPPVIKEYKIDITPEQKEHILSVPRKDGQLEMFIDSEDDKLEMTQRIIYSEIAKGFQYHGPTSYRKIEYIRSLKPQFCIDLAIEALKEGKQTCIWTIFDEESVILHKLLKEQSDFTVEVLTGKIPKKKRAAIIERFRTGEIQCLITKAQMLGYGFNFQFLEVNIISGFNDSEEQRYQLMRRSYRLGQKKTTYFHFPYIPELEGVVFNNINRKRDRISEDVREMEQQYIKAMKNLGGYEYKLT